MQSLAKASPLLTLQANWRRTVTSTLLSHCSSLDGIAFLAFPVAWIVSESHNPDANCEAELPVSMCGYEPHEKIQANRIWWDFKASNLTEDPILPLAFIFLKIATALIMPWQLLFLFPSSKVTDSEKQVGKQEERFWVLLIVFIPAFPEQGWSM